MLSDDYGSKKTLKIKHKALGATITSTTEQKKGSLLSKVGAKVALKVRRWRASSSAVNAAPLTPPPKKK